MATSVDQVVFIVSNGLIFGSILALVAVGLSLIFGTLDVPNFAQGEFASVSGFVVVGLIGIGIGLVPSIIAGIVFAFIAGITVEKLVIGKFYGRDEFLLMTFFATFGISIIAENVLRRQFGGFRQIPSPDLGSVVIAGTSMDLLRPVAGVIAVVMLLGLYLFTRHTYTGLAIRAVSSDRRGAEMVGVNYQWIYMLTFGIGAVLSGISGILYGMLFTLSPTTGVTLTTFAFTIVVLGGVGSFVGTIFASLLIGLVDTLTATVVGSRWRFFAIFAVLFVVLIFRPEGLRGGST
ncbi:branched-chain amino acid ABC transporter permease [Natrinema sp. 1APR25-10V2]|uniref:branched-chain amino acid ABC transporter permease n=1 Tax=Natrinema sp. 1APR25-10V2 TaxID=2951081 RepID=UPI0028744D44|nr:branched-chain amino acid ABC transporter permease [Natrinema sp. 1APR25-10V2]MDS0477308.1 branched-chain amino acid ABC transporter permease [Natrinema sp. 1APR25-10V2]